MWRLTDADGRESLENQNKKTTEDVEKKHLQPWFTVLEGVLDFKSLSADYEVLAGKLVLEDTFQMTGKT